MKKILVYTSLTIILFDPTEQEMQNLTFTDFFFFVLFFLINTSFSREINTGGLESFYFRGV